MPSSTSSSDAPLWRRTWAVALALVLLLLGGWESYWRLQGFTPNINNDESLWALARGRVSDQPDGVLLIGSSRMQIGIDPDAFALATGWPRPIQLAIAMGPSIPILRELSRDPAVSQHIVCGINPTIFFDAKRQLDSIAGRYIDRFDGFTPADEIEAWLRTVTQRSLVSSLPPLFPNQLVTTLRQGQRPRPGFTTFDYERFGRIDSSSMRDLKQRLRIEQLQWKNWRGRPAPPEHVERMTALVARFVNAIRKQGGDVVFVRLPTSGPTLARERELFPRSRYWDRFAAGVGAVAVHFEDFPLLRGFDLPDGSHLDQRDTAAFSDALGTVLVRELSQRDGA